MPGLLDYFNRGTDALAGQTGNYGGLLSAEDQQAAQQQARMALAAQLLDAGGYSQQRVGLGQALGRGMAAAGQARQGSVDQSLQAMLMKKQLASLGAKDGRTNFQKDYEYAKANGFKGTPEEWARVRSAQQGDPAEVVAFDRFMKETPENQEKWINFKRNSQPFQLVETARGKELLNKGTGSMQGVTTLDQEAAAANRLATAAAGGKVVGEQTATAQMDLPRLIDNADQALKTIDEFEKHPGFTQVFGASSLVPVLPGTNRAGAQAYYEQIQGKTFLEAFNSLKGAGQITEVEGQKATAAIARLNQAQGEADAKKALADLKAVIKAGSDRAKKKAGMEIGAEQAPKRSREEILNQYLNNGR
jgi:hypothetical protein